MKLIVPVLLLLASLASAGPAASDGDPLDSAACRAARAELEQALAAAGTHPGPRLERARREARDVCLGRASANPQRAGAPDPPVAVPPPVLVAPRPVPQPAVPVTTSPPPAPVPIPRPTAITTCDPGGCWDSQGRRLNQVGPVLMGPNGLCTVQGGHVTCP